MFYLTVSKIIGLQLQSNNNNNHLTNQTKKYFFYLKHEHFNIEKVIQKIKLLP